METIKGNSLGRSRNRHGSTGGSGGRARRRAHAGRGARRRDEGELVRLSENGAELLVVSHQVNLEAVAGGPSG